MKQKHIFPLTLLIACTAAGAWIGHAAFYHDADAAMTEPTQMESGDAPEEVAQAPAPITDDVTSEKLIKESNRGEALAWVQDSASPRGVARWSKDEAIGLIRDFYATGATKVYVVDTDTVAATEVASQFIVLLPTDAAARKAVFACEAKFEAEYDEDPTPDTGQKYLHLTTD